MGIDNKISVDDTEKYMKNFSIGDLFKQAFQDFKKHWKVLVGAFLIIMAINFVATFLATWLEDQNVVIMGSLLRLLLYVVQIALSVGLIRIALAVVDGRGVKMELLWDSISNWKLLVFYFLCSLLVGLAVGVGLILLIIPGIILAVKMQFSMYYIVDKTQGPLEAIKSSWNETKGAFWKLLIFDIVVSMINVIAAILFVVPLLITVPITMVAMARLYRKLSS